jgi:hypothetical protein
VRGLIGGLPAGYPKIQVPKIGPPHIGPPSSEGPAQIRLARLPGRRYARGCSRAPDAPAYPTGFIEPCLPTVARKAPNGPLWVHEIKHDGYRFICRRDGETVRVFSRADGRRGYLCPRPQALTGSCWRGGDAV